MIVLKTSVPPFMFTLKSDGAVPGLKGLPVFVHLSFSIFFIQPDLPFLFLSPQKKEKKVSRSPVSFVVAFLLRTLYTFILIPAMHE